MTQKNKNKPIDRLIQIYRPKNDQFLPPQNINIPQNSPKSIKSTLIATFSHIIKQI